MQTVLMTVVVAVTACFLGVLWFNRPGDVWKGLLVSWIVTMGIMNILMIEEGYLKTVFGGFYIYDIVLLAAMIKIVITIFRKKRGNAVPMPRVWWLFAACVVFSLIQGMLSRYSLHSIVTEIRFFLYLLVPGVYLAQGGRRAMPSAQAKKCWKRAIMALCVVCWVDWAVYAVTGQMLVPSTRNVYRGTFRVVGSGDAMVLAICALAMMYDDLVKKQRDVISVKNLFVITTVILLQHRSVWIAMGGGMLIILIKSRVLLRKQARIYIQSIAVFGTMVLFLIFNPDVSGTLFTSVSVFLDLESGTSGWRIEGWKSLLEQMNPVQYVVGRPIGSGFKRSVLGMILEQSPHSQYVLMLIRVGVIGAAGYMAMLWMTVRRVRLMRVPSAGAMLIIAVSLYMVAYQLDIQVGFLLMACVVGIFGYRQKNVLEERNEQ